jgi:hypothetical protein
MMCRIAGVTMSEPIQPYAEQYLEGRRSGMTGAERNTNPYFARTYTDESTEEWRSKYDVWRQGWMEGHDIFERDGLPKPDKEPL